MERERERERSPVNCAPIGKKTRRSSTPPTRKHRAYLGSSRMWCLRMWRLIITDATLSYTHILPNMGSHNY